MLCDEYTKLSHFEKITFIGQLVHAVQSDEGMFKLGQSLIEVARLKGVMDNVTILPEATACVNQPMQTTSGHTAKCHEKLETVKYLH